MGIQVSDRVENIMGKEEIACYEQFLLFPQCFQKLSVVDALNEYLWSKGLNIGENYVQVTEILVLTLNCTILTFNKPKEESFSKHCRKRKKFLLTSISSFFYNDFYLIKDKSHHILVSHL